MSSCPLATQVQISTMPPGRETYVDHRFVFPYKIDFNTKMSAKQTSLILVFGGILLAKETDQIQNFIKSPFICHIWFLCHRLCVTGHRMLHTMPEKFQKNPKRS